MLREDNNGFINFPNESKMFIKLDTGKTLVYIVAFDSADISNKPYCLSNSRILLPGNFVSDDVTQRPKNKIQHSIDDLVKQQLKDNEYDRIYFPSINQDTDKVMSIPLTTSICVGWSEHTFEYRDSLTPWTATFRDLSGEGRKLYYSIKKLHNNKEVRILTFNNF